jgi:hypothetical protein
VTVPFNRIERGIERSRIRLREWNQWLANATPGSPQATLARGKVEWLELYIGAETVLLNYLRRRLALYVQFPGADLPTDLAHYYAMWTKPENGS